MRLSALKKSALYLSLWKSCNELRGSMDASQYKNYVLVLLFMKYVSDKYAGRTDALLEVTKGGSFQDMVDAIGKQDIGDRLSIIGVTSSILKQCGAIFDKANCLT